MKRAVPKIAERDHRDFLAEVRQLLDSQASSIAALTQQLSVLKSVPATVAPSVTTAPQNTVQAGPVTGGNGLTSYRYLALPDLPAIASDRLLGRDTTGSGAPEELTAGGGLEFTGSGGVQRSALTGDVTASAGSGTTAIAANAVSNAKFRQSGALALVGRSANSAGDVADIQATAATDAVLRESGGVLGFGTVATGGLLNNAVTYAKLQDISATQRALGRNTSGAGDSEEVSLTQLLDWIGSPAQGDILYRGASAWARLGAGTSGQTLKTQGAAADPLWGWPEESLLIVCSDETTALTTGAAKVTFRMPYAFTLTGVRASLSTAQASGSTFAVDLNESGASVFSTTLTIDNTEKTSTTAAIPAVISDAALADDAEMTVDCDQVGDGTATGLKLWLLGRRA